MSKVRNLEELKDRAERMRREADKAAGALEQSKKQLKEKFDVKTMFEANTLLKKLEIEETSAKGVYDEAMEAFEEEWGSEL